MRKLGLAFILSLLVSNDFAGALRGVAFQMNEPQALAMARHPKVLLVEQDAEVSAVGSPPTARFTFACSILSCSFDATGSTDDTGVVSYSWSFGDPTVGWGVTTSHTYAATNSYTVTLTVTDADGLQSSTTKKVSVTSEIPEAAEGFFTVPSCRIADTRTTTPLTSGVQRLFQVAGLCGIPASAKAVSFNVTVVSPTGLGHLVFFPGNQTSSPFPHATINFDPANSPRANNANLRLATNGAGSVNISPYVAASPGQVHVILDVYGYFSEDTTPAPGAQGPFGFQTLTPCRIADTRTSTPIAVNTTRDFTVQGICGVPAGAAAAPLNLAVIGPTAGGHAILFQAGAFPPAPTINFNAGVVLANGARIRLAPTTPDVSVNYYSPIGGSSTHAVIDVFGYFKSDAPLKYRPITTCRAVDTRFADQGGPAPLGAPETRNFQIRGNCGVPTSAKAVAVNITSVGSAGQGYLIAYLSGGTLPAASYLNFDPSQGALGNGGIVALSTLPNDLAITSANSTHVIVDVFGYFETLGQGPWGGTSASLPAQRVEAENYDLGGEGLAYHDTTAGNVFGVYRRDDMDVGEIPAASGGGYHVGFLDPGEWAKYTVNITQTQNYNLRMRLASGYTGTTRFRVLLDGTDVSGAQTVTSTGDWQSYVLRTIPVGTLTAGSNHVLQFSFEVGAWNFDWFELQVAPCTPPTITQQPVSQSLEEPDHQRTITLTASAAGSPTPSLQWLKDGQPIPGANSQGFNITDPRENDFGSYQLRATNSCGTVTSSSATVTVKCGQPATPEFLLESLVEVLAGRPAVCDWRSQYKPGFPNAMGDVSYNLPVLAAAIALKADPNMAGPDSNYPKVEGWWKKYLGGELGLRGSDWYYGGRELFSYNYQQYNIASVLAVHYLAHRAGLTDVRDFAWRWLRATFTLQAAAATPAALRTLHDRGSVCFPNNPSPNYDGPYLPMAGMRSPWISWDGSSRPILFASAVGIANNGKWESDEQKLLRNFLESNWTGPGGSVYGLTTAEASALANIRNSGSLPANFNELIAGIRTIVPYHIVAWPGVRVTLLESNRNSNKAPTYGVAFFTSARDAQGNEAHFLFPWPRNNPSTGDPCKSVGKPWANGISDGAATLDLVGRFIEATNSGSAHPLETVRIDNLPFGPVQYHIVLQP